ncbi:MAG: epoxyqueuosine reductase QueH [candidate division WOR-3 bacterium]
MKPRLLLHICCGPCATVVIERLAEQYQITGFFYNPNIYPREEYERRCAAVARVAAFFNVPLLRGEYDYRVFLSAVSGLEAEPEGGRRCQVCFQLRLLATARQAKELGFTLFASTLTVGPNKQAELINRLGSEAAEQSGINFLQGDWKKQDGFRRSVELSRQLDLYRQHYCGCEFSLKKNSGRVQSQNPPR